MWGCRWLSRSDFMGFTELLKLFICKTVGKKDEPVKGWSQKNPFTCAACLVAWATWSVTECVCKIHFLWTVYLVWAVSLEAQQADSLKAPLAKVNVTCTVHRYSTVSMWEIFILPAVPWMRAALLLLFLGSTCPLCWQLKSVQACCVKGKVFKPWLSGALFSSSVPSLPVVVKAGT